MAESLSSLGIGGILVYLFIKELFQFLSKKKNGHSSGEKTTEYWQASIKMIMAEIVESKLAPILDKQVDILSELKLIAIRQTEMLIRSEIRQEDIKEGIEKIRRMANGV